MRAYNFFLIAFFSSITLHNIDYSKLKSEYQAVQCKGIAKSTGVRCKKTTTNSNGYCYLHQDQATNENSTDKVDTQTKSTSGSTHCLGIAKSTGVQCKNRTTNTNGYCNVHKSQAPDYVAPPKSNYVGRCNATTKSGTRCKRNASSGSRYCWQHQ